jgi:hypothetical protein
MSENIDDLTVSYFEDGIETVKELDKKILSKGAWTTIIFKLQDWNKAKADYGPVKFSIRRYQKRNGTFVQRSKFNISSADQANKIISALNEWLAES